MYGVIRHWRGLAVRGAALLVACMPIMVAAEPGAEMRTYRFGVVPQFDARQLAATWGPILAELDKRTGLRFELAGTSRLPEFEREFQAGRFDFAYMNPYHVLRAVQTQGYIPMVRDTAPLNGVLVVRADSGYRHVRDVTGRTIAFPSPNAMAASLMLRAELAAAGITFKPTYVQTHSSVYLNVATGRVEAGGGAQRTLDAQPEAVRARLRVIYSTRSVPSHPFVAHPRVPANVRERVRAALLALEQEPAGRAMLAGVQIKALEAARMEDYQPVAALHLDRLAVWE